MKTLRMNGIKYNMIRTLKDEPDQEKCFKDAINQVAIHFKAEGLTTEQIVDFLWHTIDNLNEEEERT